MQREARTMQQPSSELVHKLIEDHVRDAIVLTDADGLTIWTNPAFTRISGYTHAEIAGRRPGDVLQGPETSPQSKAEFRRALTSRVPAQIDVVNYSKTGESYIVEVFLSPIFDENGRLTNFIAMQRDVTDDRTRAELIVDLRAYQRALEKQAIVSVTDSRGRIIFANQKFCEISGYSESELIGQTHGIVNSCHHDRSFFEELWRTIGNGEIWHGEICNRKKSGDLYWVDSTIVPVLDSTGKARRYISIRFDVTERKMMEADLVRQAETDALTGLANRARFSRDLRQALAEAADGEVRRSGCLLIIDIDHFKDLSDSRGHEAGDQLLKEMARRLVEFVGPQGNVARLGGDEFAAIIPTPSTEDHRALVRQLHHSACDAVSLDGAIYLPSVSIGVAEYARDARTAEGLMINADTALYEAKRNGRKAFEFYNPDVRLRRDYRFRLRAIVEDALRRDDAFDIALQPICATQTRRHVGFEVLARLTHDEQQIPPDQFIPIAEEYGLINDVGRAITSKALSTYRSFVDDGFQPGTLAINVSAIQFRDPDFVESILDLLFWYGMGNSALTLEVTETALIGRSKEVVAQALQHFRQVGVVVALDDFGTGFSSLAHLRDFEVDKIKVDKSFIQNMEVNPNDEAMVRGLVQLAQSLALEIVAEGVETDAQFSFLSEIGCHYVQGYLYSRPLSIAQAGDYLRALSRPLKKSFHYRI